jgi:membrane associated rhomboid family serine protease
VLIGAFIVQCLLLVYGGVDLGEHLALTASGVRGGKVWQLLTFQFLHACPMPFHVLFNCLGLYFFGRPVEERLGGKRFLQLYFLSGVAGGLLQVLVTLALPHHPDFGVVGASAGVCGMVAIFCSLNPMDNVVTWIYFFPVTIRARYVLIFLAAWSAFGTIVPFDSVAHAAHLGGLAVGVIYVRWGGQIGEWFSRQRFQPSRAGKRRETPAISARAWMRTRKDEGEREETATFISREVDPILDKISAHGFESLTERERKILEKARSKMGKG